MFICITATIAPSKWLHVGRQNVEAGSAVLIDLNTPQDCLRCTTVSVHTQRPVLAFPAFPPRETRVQAPQAFFPERFDGVDGDAATQYHCC